MMFSAEEKKMLGALLKMLYIQAEEPMKKVLVDLLARVNHGTTLSSPQLDLIYQFSDAAEIAANKALDITPKENVPAKLRAGTLALTYAAIKKKVSDEQVSAKQREQRIHSDPSLPAGADEIGRDGKDDAIPGPRSSAEASGHSGSGSEQP